MQKILRYLFLALCVLGLTLPAFGKAEAAKLAVLPIVTNEESAEEQAASRRVWNEQCAAIFKFPQFNIVDDTDMDLALKDLNYKEAAKEGPDEALIRQVMEKTGADMGIMLVLEELSLEPVIPPTKDDYYILAQKGRLMLVNKISGEVKSSRINEEDMIEYAVTVRSDYTHDQLRNTITRELKKISKAKK